MRFAGRNCVALFGAIVLSLAGCGLDTREQVQVEFGEDLSTFQLLSGETGRHQGVITLVDAPTLVAYGAFSLNPAMLSIAPAAGPGKGSVNAHDGLTIQVNIRLAAADAVDSVCETGETYGQFTVDFDTLNEVESVTPEEIALSDATLELIAEKTMSVCVETFPEFSGEVVIGGFTLRLTPLSY